VSLSFIAVGNGLDTSYEILYKYCIALGMSTLQGNTLFLTLIPKCDIYTYVSSDSKPVLHNWVQQDGRVHEIFQ